MTPPTAVSTAWPSRSLTSDPLLRRLVEAAYQLTVGTSLPAGAVVRFYSRAVLEAHDGGTPDEAVCEVAGRWTRRWLAIQGAAAAPT